MSLINRRYFIQSVAATVAATVAACNGGTNARVVTLPTLPALTPDQLLAETQRRTFNYFWQTTETARGLAPDLAPDAAPASIAAMGFALTAIPIGVEKGWITRAQGAERVMNTLVFLRDAPQGPDAIGCSGYHGFYYHFLDMQSGMRFRDSELSSQDTALLIMGVRCCGQYFDGADAGETALRTLADTLSERVEWPWMQNAGPGICMGWRPETGFLSMDWRGYNEAMIVYLLALGSATHPVGTDAWALWTSSYPQSWGTVQGVEMLTGGPLFWHQFTQCWVDMRGIRDAYMGQKGLDYFENSRRAVLSQRAYAIANPLGWRDYSADIWGLSASDGPGSATQNYRGAVHSFLGYAARGVNLNSANNYDDGTLTPMAAIGSLPFAPDLVMPAASAMYQRYGSAVFGKYGFLDSFNPSFQYDTFQSGHRVGSLGWFDTRYYGINQGPIIAMIENFRSGLLWRLSRVDPVLRRGSQRAGFTGGWLG